MKKINYIIVSILFSIIFVILFLSLGNEKISITKVNQVFKILDDNILAYRFDFPIEKLKKSRFLAINPRLRKITWLF